MEEMNVTGYAITLICILNLQISDFGKHQVSSWILPFLCCNENFFKDPRQSRTDTISDRNQIPLIQILMSSSGAEEPFNSYQPETFEQHLTKVTGRFITIRFSLNFTLLLLFLLHPFLSLLWMPFMTSFILMSEPCQLSFSIPIIYYISISVYPLYIIYLLAQLLHQVWEYEKNLAKLASQQLH